MATDRALAVGRIHPDIKSVQQAVVHPEDENRFMMAAEEAARACERAQDEKELREQFSDLLVFLRGWCLERPTMVQAAYVYPGDGFLNVRLSTFGDGYRFDLDDAVTDLDIDLTRRFDWLTAEVMQVPHRAVAGHAAIQKAILVHEQD